MTEQSLIERVARAILRTFGDAEERGWRMWQGEARAAIEAMREPTRQMCAATGDGPRTSERIWRAMIDAALADDPAKAEREGREG